MSQKQHKLYVVATVGNTPEGLLKNPQKEFITTSRVGVDFACMDVALGGETYRYTVWPDKNWTLEWAPLRWKDADEADNWVFVSAGTGPKVRKARVQQGKRTRIAKGVDEIPSYDATDERTS